MASKRSRQARKRAPLIPPMAIGKPLQVLPVNQEKQLRDGVFAEVAKNMNVAPAQVPPDVSAEIDRQVKVALSDSVRDVARVHVSQSVKGALSQGVNLANVMQDRLKGALAGLQTVTAQNETKLILDQNAALLRAKFTSLKTAGFTDDQSFQIIVTELGRPRR